MATKKASKTKPKTITLTREQLFDILEDTYSSGFIEGRRAEREEHTDISNIMVELEKKHGKYE